MIAHAQSQISNEKKPNKAKQFLNKKSQKKSNFSNFANKKPKSQICVSSRFMLMIDTTFRGIVDIISNVVSA